MDIQISKLLSIYEEESTITAAAKRYAQELNLVYNDSFRRRISKIINKENTFDKTKDVQSTKNDTDTDSNDYSNKISDLPSAWDKEKGKFLSIDEYCVKYNLDFNLIRSWKLISHNASNITYNIVFKTDEELEIDNVLNYFEKKVDAIISKPPVQAKVNVHSNVVDRLVYTDVHVGMDPNGSSNVPLYDNIKWDSIQLFRRLTQTVEHVIQNKIGNILLIDDLGDFMDGFNGETTRKGHSLPQNMDNEEAFERGVEFKVKLVEALLPHYEKIICHSTVNDNHSGSYGYLVNYAAKRILDVYSKVEYIIQRKFMDHYSIGNRTFILCHGKDIGEMKFGFKPFITPQNIAQIDGYCKENGLYKTSNIIEFSKGDSHQGVFDDTSSNHFYYYNYPAFSPPSNWVTTNFKKTKSGVYFFNIYLEENNISKHPYYFTD